MINNYLKVTRDKQQLFFFFDDADRESRARAYQAALENAEPLQMSIWCGSDKGHYPTEVFYTAEHPIVGAALSPISRAVRVIGYPFDRAAGDPR
jgi:hypothetical protein